MATSHDRPVHLIFITDSSSIATIARCKMHFLSSFSRNVSLYFHFPFPMKVYFPFSRHVSNTLGNILLERILLKSEALNPRRKPIPKLRFTLFQIFSPRIRISQKEFSLDQDSQMIFSPKSGYPNYLPHLPRVEFVSQASILHRYRRTIDHMRIHFDNHQQLMK